MSDVAEVSAAGAGEVGQAPPSSPAADRCPRCHADLARYGHSARFCPRCGSGRPGPAAVAPAESSRPAPAVALSSAVAHASAWLRVRAAVAGGVPLFSAGSLPPRGGSHSQILTGYANAMYRLGYRYETGLGSGRNPEEAIRCYFKAARLGNTAALARLAPQCVSPTPPVPPADAPVPPDGLLPDCEPPPDGEPPFDAESFPDGETFPTAT